MQVKTTSVIPLDCRVVMADLPKNRFLAHSDEFSKEERDLSMKEGGRANQIRGVFKGILSDLPRRSISCSFAAHDRGSCGWGASS